MTEDLGTPTRPHALTGEQWRLEVRTDDPPSPSADERWIRSDLDGGDRVATLKCGDGTEIPLFATGTAEETVREARRYRVGGQTVYAPLAPVDEAAFPARRVQHDGQIHAFHDRVGPGSAIPDSVVSRPNDDRTFNNSGKFGLQIETSQEWPDIGARISANPSGYTTAYVYDVSDGSLMGSTDISSLSPGDTFTVGLGTPLSAGSTYNFVLDAGGSNMAHGSLNFGNYPYTSSDGNLQLVDGAEGETGTPSGSDAINFVEIGNVGFD